MRHPRYCCLFSLLLGFASIRAQEWDDRPSLDELNDDIEYAELLNAVRLTKKQLEQLHDLQTEHLDTAVLTPELAETLEGLRDGLLVGRPGQNIPRELREAAQKARGRMHRTLGDLSTRARNLLTEEQRTALFLFYSPVRALTGYARGLPQARKAPDEHWKRYRDETVKALSQACLQAGEKQPKGQIIGELLDMARAMPDAEFETARATLVSEWSELLMPKLAKQAKETKTRDARMTWACQRLIRYPRGQMLVEIKLEAMPGE